MVPVNSLAQEVSASHGVHSIDLELFKLLGNTVQLNYAYEFGSGDAVVIGPRYTGISSDNSYTGKGWGMELQYYFGDKKRKKMEMETRDFDIYMRRGFQRYFGIFTTYDKWQKEDWIDQPPYEGEISVYSLSLGGIVDLRFLPADWACIDFYIGFGYRYSDITNRDYYYWEDESFRYFLDHFFRPGYNGLMVSTGLKIGVIFQ